MPPPLPKTRRSLPKRPPPPPHQWTSRRRSMGEARSRSKRWTWTKNNNIIPSEIASSTHIHLVLAPSLVFCLCSSVEEDVAYKQRLVTTTVINTDSFSPSKAPINTLLHL